MNFLKAKFEELFGIDVRSLALMRVSFALLIIADLINRGASLKAHYTDYGVLPRYALLFYEGMAKTTSLHLISGAWAFELFLFLLAGVVAACLLIGYKTRLMTILSWIFLVSLQNRNFLVIQGGDILFRMALFWAMFLPWGDYYSLDRWGNLKPRPQPRVSSLATFAFLLQVAAVYVFTGFLKTGQEWTQEGTAIYYALNVDQFTTPFGYFLLQFPEFLKYLTFAVLYLECYGPLLFFVPFWTVPLRIIALGLFLGMHIGINLSMRLGLFHWISLATLVAFIPTEAWDFVTKRRLPVVSDQDPRKIIKILTSIVVAFFIVYLGVWNLSNLPDSKIKISSSGQWMANALRIDQKWNMFSPKPLTDDGWYIIAGQLEDLTRVDLFRNGQLVSFDKPKSVSLTYRDQRWQKYMMNLWKRDFVKYRLYYGKYLCREWNHGHPPGQKLKNFVIIYMREDTPAPGLPVAMPKMEILWRHKCF